MIWPFPKKVTVDELRDRERARQARDREAADRTDQMKQALDRALKDLGPRASADD